MQTVQSVMTRNILQMLFGFSLSNCGAPGGADDTIYVFLEEGGFPGKDYVNKKGSQVLTTDYDKGGGGGGSHYCWNF